MHAVSLDDIASGHVPTNREVRERVEEAVAAEVDRIAAVAAEVTDQPLDSTNTGEIIRLITDTVFSDRLVRELRPVLNYDDHAFIRRQAVEQVAQVQRDDESAQLLIALHMLAEQEHVRAFLALLESARRAAGHGPRSHGARDGAKAPPEICCSITQEIMHAAPPAHARKAGILG